jgi:RimJ/RimL family protein N-acetyltransferase
VTREAEAVTGGAPRPDDATFTIRPAVPGDAPAFLELWRAVVAEGRFVRTEVVTASARHYRRRFRRPWTQEEVELVAVEGDRIIGHLNASREESPVTRHVASLGMFVAADRRGRGVGTALLTECVRWAKAVGVEKLALSVYPDNERAIALYRTFGFEPEGRLTGHSKKAIGYRDEIVMGRWLVERPAREDVT